MESGKETKEKLLESARAEFSENGYMKASLRKICAGAGVTTGALYFFFKDKDDLFTAVVRQPLAEMKELLVTHFRRHDSMLLMNEIYNHVDGDHDDFSSALIHHIYENYDAFLLLLTGSQGSRFDSAVDEIVEIIEKSYREMAENIVRQMPGKQVNSYMLHWLSHMAADAFIHLITHEKREKKALANMQKIMNFLVSSWTNLILEDKKK
ncbi:MAG: TetR/AcrR family transcriptional regulator [Prevotella sp.]|nr:TetR/AcrR family transcriptional regulator [Prevotella sp.]